jgi:hypothetical protein
MSLTLKVTIPIDSLEKLQRMSPLDETIHRVFEWSIDYDTTVDICKAVLAAMQELPYDITPKKVEEKQQSASWGIDECQLSGHEEVKLSHEIEEYDEADGESEGYDEINAEEFGHRSTGVSFHEKDTKDTWGYLGTTKDTKKDGCIREIDTEKDSETGDTEKLSEAGETETDAAASDDHADTEFNDEEEATQSDAVSRNDEQMHITVDVNADGSRTGTNFRISMDANDTWDDLACNLRRMTALFGPQTTFYFQNSFYDQRCRESLSRVKLPPKAVLRMNINA